MAFFMSPFSPFLNTYFLICNMKFTVIMNTHHYSNKYFYLMLCVICLRFLYVMFPNGQLGYFNVNSVCCFVLRIFVNKVKNLKMQSQILKLY